MAPHLLGTLLSVGCGGQSCTGCGSSPPKPKTPVEQVTPAVLQARLTQHGFDLVAANLVQLLQAVFGGSGNVAILDVAKLLGPQPLQFSGGLGLFNGKAGARDLVLTFDVKAAEITLVEGSSPARVRIAFDHARIGVEKGVIFGAASVAGFDSDAACHLKNGLGAGTSMPHLATFSGALDLVLGVDVAGKLQVAVQVSKPVLHDVGFALGKDCALQECTDQFLLESPCLECELCATGQLASDAAAAAKDLLGPILTQLLQLAGNLIIQQLLAGTVNGKPLDVEVPVDLHAMVAGASPELAAMLGQPAGPLLLRTRPSPQAFTVQDKALLARLDAAVFATASPCAVQPGQDATTVFANLPQGAPPVLPASVPVWTPTGQTLAKAVDVGVLMGPRAVQQAGWSLLRGGLLCIAVDSAALYGVSGGKVLLTAGALDLALPGLGQLARAGAPVRITVRPDARPEGAPYLDLQQEATETAVTLHLRRLGVAVEAFVHGRWLTVVELQVDAEVVAALRVQGPEIALQVRSLAVPQVEVVGDPIAPGANWHQLAPAVAQIAVSLLFSQPLAFEVDVQALLAKLVNLPVSADLLSVQAVGGDPPWLLVAIGLDQAGGKP
ncbi:MAG: hypothetical protein FJ100_03615 [Deltaproteobacteria bacterium]|nr:hypothetical protein [Deltaproteobacteria bacterium]